MHAGRESVIGIDVIGRLKPGLSRQTALAGLAVWDSGRSDGGPVDRRPASITLEPRQGTIPQPTEAVLMFSPLFFVMSTMAPELAENVRLAGPAADWRVLMFLVSGAIVSTVFFGLVPALQATRLEPVRTIRGEMTRDSRPNRARNVLIGAQVTASALLLICSAVFLRSALAASTVDPGMRTADTVIVEIVNELIRDAMVQE